MERETGLEPATPAWENGLCFVFIDITAQGVDSGYGNANKTRVRFAGVLMEGFWRVRAGAILHTLGLMPALAVTGRDLLSQASVLAPRHLLCQDSAGGMTSLKRPNEMKYRP